MTYPIAVITVAVIVTAILVGGYTYIGGLAAVVYTDMIQCGVMIAGCLLILVLGLIEVGGVGELRQRLAEAEASEAAESPNGPQLNLTDLEGLMVELDLDCDQIEKIRIEDL